MVSGRSAARATWYGLPLSSDSSCASSSACFSMRSASLFIKTPRSAALIFRHGPLSNAVRAAATALSTSAASDSATCVITSPVDGLIVGNVFPDTLSTHFPLISNFVGPILTFCSNTAAAVAIISSYFRAVRRAVISSAARTSSSPSAFARRNLSSLSMTSGGCRARPLYPEPSAEGQAPHDANALRPRSLYPRTHGGKEACPCSAGILPALRPNMVSMRGRRQHSNQLELFDFRRSQEVRAEPCFPMRFQIRDAVLRVAHLNVRFIVEVVNQQDGQEPPVAIIADYPGHARVKRAGPSPIWIGLVELGLKYFNTRRRTVGNLFRRRNSLRFPMRPQITQSETGPQQHNPGRKVSYLPHPDLKTTHADCNTRFPRGKFRQAGIQAALQETPDAKSG